MDNRDHIWVLSWFDRETEDFVGDLAIDQLSDSDVAKILEAAESEILGCEWPIDSGRASRLQTATGCRPQIELYDYFLGSEQIPG